MITKQCVTHPSQACALPTDLHRGFCSPAAQSLPGTYTGRAALDSSAAAVHYQGLLLVCKSNDSRIYFLICGKGNNPWEYVEWGIQKGKLVLSPSASDFSAFSFSGGLIRSVATFMVRHSSFWGSEKKIMSILNLYFFRINLVQNSSIVLHTVENCWLSMALAGL